jgi:hypothetical protein
LKALFCVSYAHFFCTEGLLVDKAWNFVELFNVESYAGCSVAAILFDEGFQAVFSATNGGDFVTLSDQVVAHCFADTTGGSDY